MNYPVKHSSCVWLFKTQSIVTLAAFPFPGLNDLRDKYRYVIADNCRSKTARELIFFMEVPTVKYFPKICRYCTFSAKLLMILAFLGQNFVEKCPNFKLLYLNCQ